MRIVMMDRGTMNMDDKLLAAAISPTELQGKRYRRGRPNVLLRLVHRSRISRLDIPYGCVPSDLSQVQSDS